MTHYIPIHTRENGRKRQALCGAYVLPRDHSDTPECPECAVMAKIYTTDRRTASDVFGD